MKSTSAAVMVHALRLLAILLALGFAPLTVGADLVAMSDAQMGAVSATGFSRFEVDGNTVRADFNIQAQTYTTIESLKMAYWDNGTGSGVGWDQDWTQVALGSLSEDMTLNGLFIEATFANIDDPALRRLTSVFFGFRQASGDLSAQFNSLSRISVTEGEPDERRASLADRTTFTFNNSELAFSLQLEGENRGIWVRFGAGTTRQTTP